MNLSHACATALCALLAPAALATTATGLASFEGIEEPLVRYAPATGAFRPDDFTNITDRGEGVLRMTLRYRSDEWDGDRDTQNKDRQRAEVKGLGPHQKHGENFEYAFTWRSSPGFRGASRFCHIFQLKSTNGDSGAPLVTVSIEEGQQRGTVRLWSGPARQPVTVREFTWKPEAWQAVRLRIRTSPEADGEVLASVDGDEFQGLRGVAVHRPGASDYRPKWGLYRGTKPELPLGDDYIEHKDVSARKGGEPPVPNDLETAARRHAPNSPAEALAWLEAQPVSPSRATAIATLGCEWAGRDPAAALAFAEKLSPSDGRAETMQRAFNRWTDRDAAAVLRWVEARAPRADLDDLLWYFATDSTLRYVARDQSLAGAVLIADATLRGQAVEHITLIWARREPAEAARYVEACPRLTSEQKAAIIGKIRR